MEEKKENLTESLGIVKPDVGPSPMQGYKVVVFKENKGSKTLHKILNEKNSPIKIGFFSIKRTYSAYAVNSNPNLSFHLSTKVKLPAQHKQFELGCKVYLHVSNPEPLAVWFNNDPMRLIWTEIESQFRINIKKSDIKIEDVKFRFEEVEKRILTEASSRSIRDFATVYGVNIRRIVLHHDLAEVDLKLDKAKEEHSADLKINTMVEEKASIKRKTEVIDKGHELTLKEMEAESTVKTDIYKQVVEAVKRLAEQINSPENFEKSAAAFMQVLKKYITTSRQLGTSQDASSFSEMKKALYAGEPGPAEDVRDILLEIIADIETSGCSNEDKNAMISSLTHLIAETYREGTADFEVIEKHINQLRQYSLDKREFFTRDRMERISERIKEFKKKVKETKTGTNPGKSEGI